MFFGGVSCCNLYSFVVYLYVIGIISLKIHENRYKQKISTNPYFGCYRYAIFTTNF